MKLSVANDVNRGHKSGHYLLVMYGGILLKYKILTISFGEKIYVVEGVRYMSLRDFSRISSALWEFGNHRAGKTLYG